MLFVRLPQSSSFPVLLIQENAAAFSVELSQEDRTYLEDIFSPKNVGMLPALQYRHYSDSHQSWLWSASACASFCR